RAWIQACHAGAELNQLRAIGVGNIESYSCIQLREDWRTLLDQIEDPPRDFQIGGRQSVLIADVKVHDRGPGLVSRSRCIGDLLERYRPSLRSVPSGQR